MVLLGLHIRNALKGLQGSGFELLNGCVHINMKCYTGEVKFRKAQPKRYNELVTLFNNTVQTYNKGFNKTKIATDTFMDALYRHGEHQFKTYYKLGERSFTNLFIQFGEDDDCEGASIEMADIVHDIILKELELEQWREWVAYNQRRFNEAT